MNGFRSDIYQQVIDEMKLEKLQQEIRDEVLFNMPHETLELFKRYTEKVGQEQEALRLQLVLAFIMICIPIAVMLGMAAWRLITLPGCFQ